MSATAPRIVIAGGGPVGLMVAALIASDERCRDVSVRVVAGEAKAHWREDQIDLRVYALSRASQLLFDRLGLWERILARRCSPYRTMCVWQGRDPDGVASVQFTAESIGTADLGHIVEDRLLRQVLTEYLSGRPRVELQHGTALDSCTNGSGGCRIGLSNGESLRVDLLVGADGARSVVRRLTGIAAIERPYRQRAVVAHVRTAKPHAETAWQRFGRRGPIALLPLVDGRSSIVWSVSDAEADRLSALDDGAFAAEVEAATVAVLGRVETASPRVSFPLGLMHALRYTKQSVVLAGDAAHAVHPLAGQGMNLGLLDAAALAEVIGAAAASGEHIGDRYVLDRYARARRADNFRMQLAFDGIDRLFRAGDALWPLRAAGMLMIDSLPPAKRLLIEQAMGLARGPADARAAV